MHNFDTTNKADLGMLQVNGIPKDLRKRFRVECEKRGSNMTQQVIRLMELYVNRMESKAQDHN